MPWHVGTQFRRDTHDQDQDFQVRPVTLLLAAVLALEGFGANALSHDTGRWATVAAADGTTIYTSSSAADAQVVAKATIAAN